jgi:hypothetical protein
VNHPSRIVPTEGGRLLSVTALLFVCLLLSNCPPSGGNANNANANTNANVENRNAPVENRAPTPTPSPTPVNKGTFTGKLCNPQSLGRFPTNAFRRADSSDPTCVTVATRSGTGGSTVVSFHCRKANCAADVIVKYDDGRPDEAYTINCTP